MYYITSYFLTSGVLTLIIQKIGKMNVTLNIINILLFKNIHNL